MSSNQATLDYTEVVLAEEVGVNTHPIDSVAVDTALVELRQIASDFMAKEYNLVVPIKLTTNSHLRNCLGQLVKDEFIELNTRHVYNALKFGSMAEVEDTLKHELVHLALVTLGRPNNDGDPEFEYELARLGISSSSTTNRGLIYARPNGEHFSVFTEVEYGADLDGSQTSVSQSYAINLHKKGVAVNTRVIQYTREIQGTKLFNEKP